MVGYAGRLWVLDWAYGTLYSWRLGFSVLLLGRLSDSADCRSGSPGLLHFQHAPQLNAASRAGNLKRSAISNIRACFSVKSPIGNADVKVVQTEGQDCLGDTWPEQTA